MMDGLEVDPMTRGEYDRISQDKKRQEEQARALAYLMMPLKQIVSDLQNLTVKKVDTEIDIGNLQELAYYFPKFPSKVSISNLQEMTGYLSGLIRAIEKVKIDVPEPKVTINLPEPKFDLTLPESLKLDDAEFRRQSNLLDSILEALEPLGFISNKAGKPITVRLSDGKRFIEALALLNKKQDRIISTVATAQGMTVDEFKTIAGIPKTGGQGKVTVTTAGTPVNVSTTSVACNKVYLSADTDAGIVLTIGFSNSIRATLNNKNGIILIPGNDVVAIETNDLKNLWVDAHSNGGILCYTYTNV